MNLKLLYLLSFILLMGSCKSRQNNKSTRVMSAKKVIKSHYNASFDKQTVTAKIKTHYDDGKTTQNITIKLHIIKDEVIWMNASFLGLSVARVKITPSSVQYYEKLKKTYFDGDFSLISDMLGTEMSFQQIQNLLVGEAIFNLNDEKYKSELNLHAYQLTPKQQSNLFSILYWVNPTHFKIDKQRVTSDTDKKSLDILYKEYQEIENTFFPKTINILAKQPKQTIKVDMNFYKVNFNKKSRIPFTIPRGYQSISN